MLNKSKHNSGNVNDIHENENNANLGERAKGKDRYQNPRVDVVAAELELKKEIVETMEDKAPDDRTLYEAVESSDEDGPTTSGPEARASDAEHCKDKLEDVGMEESQSDKPEGEDDVTGLGQSPDDPTPSDTQPSQASPTNDHKSLKHKRMSIRLLDASGRHFGFTITGINDKEFLTSSSVH